MKLVLQCAMCGTHHPVGTPACTTCRASGVAQMRLMFECPTCGHLGINPVCEACPFIEPLDLDEDLIIAEEIIDEPMSLDPAEEEGSFEDFDLDLDFDEDDAEDEAVIVDLSEESLDDEEDEGESDLDDSDLDDSDPDEDFENEFEEELDEDDDLYDDFDEDESDEDFEDQDEEEEDDLDDGEDD